MLRVRADRQNRKLKVHPARPLGAFLPSLFPPRVRFTGASMTFNIAGILGAAPVPLVAQYLAEHGGLAYVGYYLSVAALVSLTALRLVERVFHR